MAQLNYYKEYIENKPGWTFAGVYTDRKSGKAARSRKGFKEMICMATSGGTDLIITKSISRFARNLLETLNIIRKLRELGIGVYFEKEDIDSLDSKSDLLLSLYATVAESELTSMGENVRWAARKRYKAGSVEQPNTLYGYTFNENNKLIPLPQEAETVKLIFKLYLSGKGTNTIAKQINEKGIKRKLTNEVWRSSDISRLLKNEKYAGDALLQKEYYINLKRHKNNGEIPQYYVENDHEAIVSREDYLKVQQIIMKKTAKHKSYNSYGLSPFSGKIRCSECNKNYLHRKNNRNTTYEKWIWSCQTYIQRGRNYCKGYNIREKDLFKHFLSAYNEAISYEDTESELGILNDSLKDLLAQERELIALKAKGYISKLSFGEEHSKLLEHIKTIESEYAVKARRINGKMERIPADAYSDKLVNSLESAIIEGYKITFKFKNGAAVSRIFNNDRKRRIDYARRKSSKGLYKSQSYTVTAC